MSLRNGAKLATSFTVLFLFVFASLIPFAQAQEQTPEEASIIVDKKPIKTKYLLRNGHLHVPALFFKNTGTYVDWNDQYQSAVFRLKGKMFALPIGKKYYDEYLSESNTWKRHALPVETIQVDGKPYVPLVAVSQKLGMNVTYDPGSQQTFISTNNPVPSNQFRHGDGTQKLVALTFDDGPDNHYTPMILDILKEKGVPATFFMMGKNVRKYPNQVKRIVADGHGIGNHSYNHPDLRKLWTSKVTQEIESTQQEILKAVGRKPDIIRPPYGAVTKADIAKLNELGLRNVLWSVDTLDWEGRSSEEILKTVHEQFFPGGIILQHNFDSSVGALDGSVEALPKIIDELKEKGYTFVTVQTMLESQKR